MLVGQNGDVLQRCATFDRMQHPGELKPIGFAIVALGTKPLCTPGPWISAAARAVAELQTGAGFA